MRYIARRVVLLIPVMLGITIFVFSLSHLAPGNPVRVALGIDYTPEQAEAMREELGLDDPLPVQYVNWLGGVMQGDFGRSIVMNASVEEIILQRLPTTMALAVASVFFSLLISIPLGVAAAIRKDTWIDNLFRVLAVLGASMPVFWVGILLLMIFAVRLDWLPAGGSMNEHGFKALILPAIALSGLFAALIMRMVRSTMLEVLGEDYIRTARAKGLGSLAVNVRHALRNALIPTITVIGLQFGSILGGAVVTETIFNIPGLGSLLVTAASSRDYPMIQGIILVTATAFVLVNLLVDVIYVLVNPQIRYD